MTGSWASLLLAAGLLSTPGCRREQLPDAEAILAGLKSSQTAASLRVVNPFDETVYPADMAPPTFTWKEGQGPANTWLVSLDFGDGQPELHRVVPTPEWRPSTRDWDSLKQRSRERMVVARIAGVNRGTPGAVVSSGTVRFQISADPVGAPIFYREVNLPFAEAVKDPSKIRWRLGSVATTEPPRVVLQNLPVCGNCHSFTANGDTLAMDVDYANNKGSYIITRLQKQMTLATSDVITWSDYRKEDNQETFGLLSQISPDGRHVISTVKDKSVFVATPDLAFSQLFFPIKGILVYYARNTKTFHALPGADNPEYVHSNPTWSPDGKYLVFARTRAYQLKRASATGKVLLTAEECEEFLKDKKPFKFDLYRIPFNDGRGGEPEPIEGASNDGTSNYFPKYTPDGRWIVFCKASNYMLLQPDSELFIIPAQGGKPRRLRCNTPRMNSWHSFSPNGRWMVFSSKMNGPFTQLFLTHLDAEGNTTPPVLLSHFTAPDRAANIPEFVNTRPDAIANIREQFLDDYSLARAAYTFENMGDLDRAITDYGKALKINPNNAHAHQRLGYLLYHHKQQKEAGTRHTLEALRIEPSDGCAHFDLGLILLDEDKPVEAAQRFAKALQLLPGGFDRRYTPLALHSNLGQAYVMAGQSEKALPSLTETVKLAPGNASAWHGLAFAYVSTGDIPNAVQAYNQAMALDPSVDDPAYHDALGIAYSRRGDFARAAQSAGKAIELARKAGDAQLASALAGRLDLYQRRQPYEAR